MNIIFLDFDGVITTEQSGFKIDRKKIQLLNGLIVQTRAKVVVTSTWKYRPTPVPSLQLQLNLEGFIGEIIDVTKLDWEDRGKEIEDWLAANKVRNYVILDDTIKDITPYGCSKFLVQTKIVNGLTKRHVEQAEKILLN